MIPILFLAAGWLSPTQQVELHGLAAYSYRVESAAQARGISLDGWGCALMARGDLGRGVWVQVAGRWFPCQVVDCSQREHYQGNLDPGRVIELPWELWQELGLPLAPVPVTVSFVPPLLASPGCVGPAGRAMCN